jgi:DNA-directed RNA polymerase subunit beta
VALNDGKDAVGEQARFDISHEGKVIVAANTEITEAIAKELKAVPDLEEIKLRARLTEEIEYLDAFEEEKFIIGQANVEVDEKGYFVPGRVAVRVHSVPSIGEAEDIDCVDLSPKQIISVTTSLIPFLEHDDANRALMGSNMQRQAVVPLVSEAPYVGTGMEEVAALNSGQVVLAGFDGEIVEVDARKIVLKAKDGKGKEAIKEYKLNKFKRSNQFTCISQRPIVVKGQKVKEGEVLADGPAIDHGVLSLGRNLTVAFMGWEGANFEDAIILSERVVSGDKFSSIHIDDYECDVRDTKLGPEVTTPDIPNVSEDKLKNLDEEGIVRIGAEVGPGDILVGKISPKGESELTAEERLLRAIFGEKVRDVKDTSLTMSHGKRGRIVGIKNFNLNSLNDSWL